VLEIRPIDLSPAGIAQTCELLNAVFPSATHIDTGYLERLFNGCPYGPTSGFSGFDDGQLVAHYVNIPIRARVEGELRDGIWPFQFAVHPQYQGKGAFRALGDRIVEEMTAEGESFVVGITNANSTPIMQKLWGYHAVAPLEVKVGVGPMPERDPGDDLRFVRIWDEAAIAWRLKLPAEPYRVLRRRGVAHLYAPGDRMGIHVEVGAFPESLVPDDLDPLRTANPLRMWIGLDPARRWRARGYVDLPERWKPSPLILTFFDFRDAKHSLDPAQTRFNVFDFDAY